MQSVFIVAFSTSVSVYWFEWILRYSAHCMFSQKPQKEAASDIFLWFCTLWGTNLLPTWKKWYENDCTYINIYLCTGDSRCPGGTFFKCARAQSPTCEDEVLILKYRTRTRKGCTGQPCTCCGYTSHSLVDDICCFKVFYLCETFMLLSWPGVSSENKG